MGKEEAINKRKAAINYSKAEGRNYKIDVINNYDNYYFFLNLSSSDALKLYTGTIRFTTSIVSYIFSNTSSGSL